MSDFGIFRELINLKKIIKDLLNTKAENEAHWEALKQTMNEAITSTQTASFIQEAIHLDENDRLPFEQKKMLYEKLIELEAQPTHLQNFAWWLQLNGGPAWDAYAEALLQRASS